MTIPGVVGKEEVVDVPGEVLGEPSVILSHQPQLMGELVLDPTVVVKLGNTLRLNQAWQIT